jgi:alpha-tubulin suppressor-like RCC1 family protein
MRRHGSRSVAVILVSAALGLGSLPSTAVAATPDGQPAPEFLTWGGDPYLDIPEVTSLPAGTTVTDLAAGGDFLVGLLSDGHVRVWGQLNGSAEWTDSLADTKVVAIAAGMDDAMVLTEDGDLRSWGLSSGFHDYARVDVRSHGHRHLRRQQLAVGRRAW